MVAQSGAQMKIAIILLCLPTFAFAQQKYRLGQAQPGMRYAAACGTQATNFKVKLDDSQHGPLIPQPGMAQIYFIHEAGTEFDSGRSIGYPTTKYGVDGSWAGANHGDSWFAFPVAPGEHHLCANLQSSLVSQRVELTHFTAEAGKSYFFRSRLVLSGSVELLSFQPADSDEGALLVSSLPMATASAKK
jgi:hypothetical protein